MKVSDVMTKSVEYIEPGASLMEAAIQMQSMGCGFLPIVNQEGTKLEGVVTDRDIVVRGVAAGLDPTSTTVHQIRSDHVLYCFADDDLAEAMAVMSKKKVYRLIVLNNRNEKRLAGILTLGDVTRNDEQKLAMEAAKAIAGKAA